MCGLWEVAQVTWVLAKFCLMKTLCVTLDESLFPSGPQLPDIQCRTPLGLQTGELMSAHEGGSIIVPILMVRKLRNGKVSCLRV